MPSQFHTLMQSLLSPTDAAVGDNEPRRLASRDATRLLGLTAIGLSAYGLAAGFFQGGQQVAVAALKAPLLVAATLLLCLPSLWAMTTLAGVAWTGERFFGAVAAFAATLSVLLAGLLPVNWLFSVSSRSLASVVLLHVAAWLAAVLIAQRTLRGFAGTRGGFAVRLWVMLFVFVSLQVATYLQPVLFRNPGEPIFATPRQLFLEHFAASARVRHPAAPTLQEPAAGR